MVVKKLSPDRNIFLSPEQQRTTGVTDLTTLPILKSLRGLSVYLSLRWKILTLPAFPPGRVMVKPMWGIIFATMPTVMVPGSSDWIPGKGKGGKSLHNTLKACNQSNRATEPVKLILQLHSHIPNPLASGKVQSVLSQFTATCLSREHRWDP